MYFLYVSSFAAFSRVGSDMDLEVEIWIWV